jgi:predicted dehydrogenase
MHETTTSTTPRRAFLKNAVGAAAASALAGATIPHVHAAEDNTIRLALIGCGSRGSGAVGNALSAPGGPVKLFAMADVFGDRLEGSHKALKNQFGDKVDVAKERQFVGFDAYRKAIDCLRPGDVAMLTTHAAFRPTHLDYAVEKGVNVFMEKSFAPDPPGVQQVLRAGEAAEKKNLKVAAGLMCRHSSARQALIQKIRDGAIGDVLLILATRMDTGYMIDPGKPVDNELLWQIRRAHCFLWASSGMFIEQIIHQVDECCWIKDAWPVAAHGVGGRVAGSTNNSQNLDSYAIEYTFADGTKAMATSGSYLLDGFKDFATFIHGTKCAAQFSGNIHAPTSQIYKDQRATSNSVAWKPPKETVGPHQAEWNVLLDAIRNDRPHNEARRAAYSNLAAIMGRAAVHLGKTITWDQAMASKFQFCPNVAALTAASPAPVRIDSHGRYPVPAPGMWSEI